MAVSKRLRYEILKRDEHACKSCGRTPPEVKLEIDHVVPVALGGSDDPSNLVTACQDCNRGKSSVPADAPLVAAVAEDALRWARAMEVVAAQRAMERKEAKGRHKKFHSAWKEWYTTDWRGNKIYVDLPANWEGSVDQFIDAGLDLDIIIDLIRVAMGARISDEWKYFCGCCWRRIKEDQDRTASVIAAQDGASAAASLSTVWTQAEVDSAMDEAEDMASGLEVNRRNTCRHVSWTPEGAGHCGDPVCVVEYAANLMHYALDWHFAESDREQRDMRIFEELETVDG